MLVTKPQKLNIEHSKKIPLFSFTVEAGFPSPAEDNIERKLNLHELLIKHPSATFFVKAHGNSMQNSGIFNDDILIVDRSIEPAENMTVVATISGDFTVKKLGKIAGRFHLIPSNPAYKPILVDTCDNVEIWGIVTYVIHKP
ncbi:translesion error-prone DNA polymerase V autoproteolytic subunit [Candidatus Dojkabacteria bacterium]|nr:translesion error-prone DNA polymerase V autoproteolytic subunit [Candidatus Dojkabacteria bacterium]